MIIRFQKEKRKKNKQIYPSKMKNIEKLTSAQDRFNILHEFLMELLLLEEKLKREFIEDELTGVYLIPKEKLEGIINQLKKKAIPVAQMPKSQNKIQYQRVLNGITNNF